MFGPNILDDDETRSPDGSEGGSSPVSQPDRGEATPVRSVAGQEDYFSPVLQQVRQREQVLQDLFKNFVKLMMAVFGDSEMECKITPISNAIVKYVESAASISENQFDDEESYLQEHQAYFTGVLTLLAHTQEPSGDYSYELFLQNIKEIKTKPITELLQEHTNPLVKLFSVYLSALCTSIAQEQIASPTVDVLMANQTMLAEIERAFKSPFGDTDEWADTDEPMQELLQTPARRTQRVNSIFTNPRSDAISGQFTTALPWEVFLQRMVLNYYFTVLGINADSKASDGTDDFLIKLKARLKEKVRSYEVAENLQEKRDYLKANKENFSKLYVFLYHFYSEHIAMMSLPEDLAAEVRALEAHKNYATLASKLPRIKKIEADDQMTLGVLNIMMVFSDYFNTMFEYVLRGSESDEPAPSWAGFLRVEPTEAELEEIATDRDFSNLVFGAFAYPLEQQVGAITKSLQTVYHLSNARRPPRETPGTDYKKGSSMRGDELPESPLLGGGGKTDYGSTPGSASKSKPRRVPTTSNTQLRRRVFAAGATLAVSTAAFFYFYSPAVTAVDDKVTRAKVSPLSDTELNAASQYFLALGCVVLGFTVLLTALYCCMKKDASTYEALSSDVEQGVDSRASGAIRNGPLFAEDYDDAASESHSSTASY